MVLGYRFSTNARPELYNILIRRDFVATRGLSALVPEQVPEGSQGNSATREFVIVNLGISC